MVSSGGDLGGCLASKRCLGLCPLLKKKAESLSRRMLYYRPEDVGHRVWKNLSLRLRNFLKFHLKKKVNIFTNSSKDYVELACYAR